MKTKEELNALKNGGEALNKKLAELSDEELNQVAGGWGEEQPGGPKNWEDSEGKTSTVVV